MRSVDKTQARVSRNAKGSLSIYPPSEYAPTGRFSVRSHGNHCRTFSLRPDLAGTISRHASGLFQFTTPVPDDYPEQWPAIPAMSWRIEGDSLVVTLPTAGACRRAGAKRKAEGAQAPAGDQLGSASVEGLVSELVAARARVAELEKRLAVELGVAA